MIIPKTDLTLQSVSGQELDVKGVVDVYITVGRTSLKHRVYVTDMATFPGSILLGTDFLRRVGPFTCHLDETHSGGWVDIAGVRLPFENAGMEPGSTGVILGKESVRSANAVLVERLHIPPSSVVQCCLQVKLPEGTEVLVEGNRSTPGVSVAHCVARVHQGRVPIQVANCTPHHVNVRRAATLGIAVPLGDVLDEGQGCRELPECGDPDLSGLSAEHQQAIQDLLREHRHVVSQNETDIGHTTLEQHRIDTGDAPPKVTKQWPLPHSKKQDIENEVRKLLSMGIIEPCASEWSSPVLLIKKKSGSFRFCIDYRSLNQVTKKDIFPLPRLDEVLQGLQGATVMTKLDLRSGYFQCDVHEEDRPKTAFTTMSNTYQFKRLPFGLCNAPSTFQRLMQRILSPVLGRTAYCFIDDILIFSKTFEDHLKDLREVLGLIAKAGLKISPEKCSFARSELEYLGHKIGAEGIAVDEGKVAAIHQIRPPRTPRQMRSFLGMANYYRRFVPHFSEIAMPLTLLTKKNQKFVWTEAQQKAFDTLKTALVESPILRYPDFSIQFQLHCDASDTALGGVLMQKVDGVDHPIAYYSRKFNDAEGRYSVSEKEALAIVASVKHFAHYLYGYHFVIYTDHAPLRQLFQYKQTLPRITRWAIYLAEFTYDLCYKPGKEHIVPDLLSRHVDAIGTTRGGRRLKQTGASTQQSKPRNSAAARPRGRAPLKPADPIRPPTSPDLSDMFSASNVQREQKKDPYIKELLCRVEGSSPSTDPSQEENYTIEQGCLYYLDRNIEVGELKQRLVVPLVLRNRALELTHNSPTGGHFGVTKTLHHTKRLFFWPKMASDVKQHVTHCVTCQKRTYRNLVKAPIQALPPVRYPLQRVGIDLIGELSPSYSGNRYIFTIVCHFSRFVQAYALPNKHSETVADAFMDYICRYGCPEHIVSDRGGEFTAQVFSDLMKKLKMKTHLTTSYHAASNGMTEAFNKLIKNTLTPLVQDDYHTWDEQLPYAILALNTSFHQAVANTPYFLFFGREPSLPYSDLLGPGKLNYALGTERHEDGFERLRKAFLNAKEASDAAHERNVKYQTVRMVPFKVGDAVFLSNDSARRGPYSKFRPKWVGPLRITAEITPVNFQLEGIYSRREPQIVHANRLKLAKIQEAEPYLPDPEPLPVEILENNLSSETLAEPGLISPRGNDSDNSGGEEEATNPRNDPPCATPSPGRKYRLRSAGRIPTPAGIQR